MSEAQPTRPDALRPALSHGRGWLAPRPSGRAGVVAAAVGGVSFIVVAAAQPQLWATPDWRLSVPGLVVTAIIALVSIARREVRAYPYWLAGLGLAGAAVVLGWFLMLAIVVGATAALILILHAVL